MKFRNEIRLALPAEDVFARLADVERVAPCLPGARLEGREGDAHRGAMRVKVGPVVADYGGTLTFEQLDSEERRAVLLARGEEKTGQGSAEARIVSSVFEDGDGARIVVETDLQVRGRVAQFGSGPMEKIAQRMFADFARNLEGVMTAEQRSSAEIAAAEPASGDESRARDAPDPEASRSTRSRAPDDGRDASSDSLDVLSLVAGSVPSSVRAAAVPVLVALAIGYLLGRMRATSA